MESVYFHNKTRLSNDCNIRYLDIVIGMIHINWNVHWATFMDRVNDLSIEENVEVAE